MLSLGPNGRLYSLLSVLGRAGYEDLVPHHDVYCGIPHRDEVGRRGPRRVVLGRRRGRGRRSGRAAGSLGRGLHIFLCILHLCSHDHHNDRATDGRLWTLVSGPLSRWPHLE